ncbi:hypothetical protein TSH100_02545 [Azospirillum sp. TSH100]|uniref:hypothetical protein n=1 Tax=Azospirillum sp. TSH100 TaxID=652764 RepID=UPI000D622026|nr:hypothetical protein [Azospirillum sp. TSH100]PWC90909.1 hypothetical protein TSH100_02545 [Azospirillum sp. TSH100]QCG90724.1 hypothetical protein E6C72_23360 [Azospirillum sp. TSH100]
MLGAILETAIGLMLVFLLTSLACSVLQEIFANLTSWRGRNLRNGIRQLLNDPDMSGFAKMFYEHPLIAGLSRNCLPSYLSASTFAKVVADLVEREGLPNNGALTEPLAAVMRIAGSDPDKFRAELEAWYNEAMDRVGGWYKRNVQLVLLILGFAVAVGLNINTLAIAHTLWTQPLVRELAVARAGEIVGEAKAKAETARTQPADAGSNAGPGKSEPPGVIPSLQKQLNDLQVPVGWGGGLPNSTMKWLGAMAGWLITACATALGTQFWFNVLSTALRLRAAGPKPDEATS